MSKEIEARLPLKQVEWKSANLPAFIANNPATAGYKTKSGSIIVKELQLDLQKYSSDHSTWSAPNSTSSFKHAAISLRHYPYLHLFIAMNCEDQEEYKSKYKRQIQVWLDQLQSLSAKRVQEWLIVYVSKEPVTSNTRSLLTNKNSALDRLKSDFNTGKRDRCLQISLASLGDESMWQDLFNRMVDGLFYTFGLTFTQLHEDLKRIDAQRRLPGFNYCNFFLMKEGMGTMLENMGLAEEALILYDELEATFFECLNSNLQKDAIPWTENFGANDPMDDSANILISERKFFQELMSQNCISIFDFRTYLFSRQVELLRLLNRPAEICLRAKLFINSMSKSIVENSGKLIPFFLESWIYSSCKSMIKYISQTFSEQATSECNHILAELLLDARRQLDKFGEIAGFISSANPYSYATDDVAALTSCSWKITNEHLQKALSGRAEFKHLYEKVTQLAIEKYGEIRCPKTHRSLCVDLAKILFYNSDYIGCITNLITSWIHVPGLSQAFSGDEFQYVKVNLDDIDVFSLSLLIKSLAAIDDHGRLVIACLILLQDSSTLSEAAYAFYANVFTISCGKMSKNISISMNDLFDVKIGQVTNDSLVLFEHVLTAPSGRCEGRIVGIEISSPFDFKITPESCRLTMLGKNGNQIQYHLRHDAQLLKGRNSVSLQCVSEIPQGRYTIDKFGFCVGLLQIETSLMESGKYMQTHNIFHSTSSVFIDLSDTVECDSSLDGNIISNAYSIRLLLQSNKSEISPGAKLHISSHSGISVDASKKCEISQKHVIEEISCQRDIILIENGIDSESLIQFRIPISVDSPSKDQHISIIFEYETHDLKLCWSSEHSVAMFPPLEYSLRTHYHEALGMQWFFDVRSHFYNTDPIIVHSSTLEIPTSVIYPSQTLTFTIQESTVLEPLVLKYHSPKVDFINSVYACFESMFINISGKQDLQELEIELLKFISWFVIKLSSLEPNLNQVVHVFSLSRIVRLRQPYKVWDKLKFKTKLKQDTLSFALSRVGQPKSSWREVAVILSSGENLSSSAVKVLGYDIKSLSSLISYMYESDYSTINAVKASAVEYYSKSIVAFKDPVPDVMVELDLVIHGEKQDCLVGEKLSAVLQCNIIWLNQNSRPYGRISIEISKDDCWAIAGKSKFSGDLESHSHKFIAVPLKAGILLYPTISIHIDKSLSRRCIVSKPTSGAQILVVPKTESRSFWIGADNLEFNDPYNTLNNTTAEALAAPSMSRSASTLALEHSNVVSRTSIRMGKSNSHASLVPASVCEKPSRPSSAKLKQVVAPLFTAPTETVPSASSVSTSIFTGPMMEFKDKMLNTPNIFKGRKFFS